MQTTTQQLRDEIFLVKNQFSQYAHQIVEASEASVTLSKTVNKFYSEANHPGRSESVNVYSKVQEDIANRAVNTFGIQVENGLLQELQNWIDIIKNVDEQIEDAERTRMVAHDTQTRLASLQSEYEEKKHQKATFLNGFKNREQDLEELSNRIREHANARKSLYTDYQKSRNKVAQSVKQMMNQRFVQFDRIYVQMLECQCEYFQHTANVSKKFQRSIDYYRKQFPKDDSFRHNQNVQNDGKINITNPNKDDSPKQAQKSKMFNKNTNVDVSSNNDDGKYSNFNGTVKNGSGGSPKRKKPTPPTERPPVPSYQEHKLAQQIQNNQSKSQQPQNNNKNKITNFKNIINKNKNKGRIAPISEDMASPSSVDTGTTSMSAQSSVNTTTSTSPRGDPSNKLSLSNPEEDELPGANRMRSVHDLLFHPTSPKDVTQNLGQQQTNHPDQGSLNIADWLHNDTSTSNDNHIFDELTFSHKPNNQSTTSIPIPNNNNNNITPQTSDDPFDFFNSPASPPETSPNEAVNAISRSYSGSVHGRGAAPPILTMNPTKSAPTSADDIIIGYDNRRTKSHKLQPSSNNRRTKPDHMNDAMSKAFNTPSYNAWSPQPPLLQTPNKIDDMQLSDDEKTQMNNIVLKGKSKKAAEDAYRKEMERRRIEQNKEKQKLEDRHKYLALHEAELNAWEYENTVRRNVRTLIGKLPDVLPKHLGWKPIPFSKLLNDAHLRKGYFKAIRVVHPDRAISRNDDTETVVICEIIFQALEQAYKKQFG